MNIFKSITTKLLSFAIALTMLCPTTALTAAAATVPDSVKVGTYKNGYYYTGTYNGAPIEVEFDAAGDKITNLKSSSDKLRVYMVYNSTSNKLGRIGTWSNTPGTYTVTFDICGSDGTVKESKSVQVVVYYYGTTVIKKSPVKDIKYAGKSLYSDYDYVSMPASGKLSVTMNKNFKLKGLRIGKMSGKNNEYKYSKFKNNKNLKLSKKYYKYNYKSGSSYEYSRKNMAAYTYVEVTYQNKKTKETGVITYSIGKLINYVK